MKKLIYFAFFLFLPNLFLAAQDCACDNIILNPNLLKTIEPTDGDVNSFCDGMVDNWASAFNTPHHINIDANETCNTNGDGPIFNCLTSRHSASGLERAEGINYYKIDTDDIDLDNDVEEFVTIFKASPYIPNYCVSFTTQGLECPNWSTPAYSDQFLFNCIASSQLPDCIPLESQGAFPFPNGVNFEPIGTSLVQGFNPISATFNFTPLQDYEHLLFYADIPSTNPNSTERSRTSISNVSITCNHTALTGIEETMDDCNTYSFNPIIDGGHPIATYTWDFGGEGTSEKMNPSHTFQTSGEYEICLDAKDIYGCCASICTTIVVECCPVDENTIYIDATDPSTDSFSDLVTLGIFNEGGSLIGRDLVIKGEFTLDVYFNFDNCNFYFEPGAELIVRSPSYIQIQNSNFSGCSRMWKGISVQGTEPQNRFIFKRNYISDAYTALSILEGSNIQMSRDTFDANYIGIYSPPNNGVIKNHFGSNVRNCLFISEKEMLPQYNGQPSWNERTYCGVRIFDLDYLSVSVQEFSLPGPGALPGNKFEGIQNGIYFQNSNVRIKGNKFKNMQTNQTEFGIRGELCLAAVIYSNTFTDVLGGIEISNSIGANISISRNDFLEENVVVPSIAKKIIVRNLNFSSIRIVENDLQINELIGGIAVSNCNALSHLSVRYNIINKKSANSNGHISINNIHKVVGAEGIVSGNILTCEEIGSASYLQIKLVNADNFVVSNNTSIAKLSNTTFQFGLISILNSESCLLSDNEVNFEEGSGYGYRISGSPGNIYCCNEAINASRGFHFFGENKDSELRSSIFTNNNIGLYLYNASIGPQPLHGNFWEGTTTKAFNLADMGSGVSFEESIFYVNPAQPGTRPDIVVPSDWFIDSSEGLADLCPEGNTDMTCGSDNWGGFNFSSPLPGEDLCDHITQVLIELVGPEVYWHFQNQNDWVFYKYVFDNYKDIPLELWENCFPIPEKEVNIKTVAEYYHTDKKYKEAFKPGVVEASQIQTLNHTLSIAMDALEGLLNMVETEQDYEAHRSDIIALQTQIAQLNTELDILIQGVRTNGDLTLQNLSTEINSLPSDFYFLDDLKYVWNIKIQIDLLGINSVTAIEWDEVRRIGDECILEYGDAVYEAQTLLNQIEEYELGFGEDCSPQSDPKSSNEVSSSEITCYPNPGSGLFQVNVPKLQNSSLSLRVYDVNGRIVYSKNLEIQNIVDIDLTNQNNGIYYLQITNNEESVFESKLVLIK